MIMKNYLLEINLEIVKITNLYTKNRNIEDIYL